MFSLWSNSSRVVLLHYSVALRDIAVRLFHAFSYCSSKKSLWTLLLTHLKSNESHGSISYLLKIYWRVLRRCVIDPSESHLRADKNLKEAIVLQLKFNLLKERSRGSEIDLFDDLWWKRKGYAICRVLGVNSPKWVRSQLETKHYFDILIHNPDNL